MPAERRAVIERHIAYLTETSVVEGLTLMEVHHGDAPTATVYADIRATLDLPVVNTDYRALARWPSYFQRCLGRPQAERRNGSVRESRRAHACARCGGNSCHAEPGPADS